MAAQRGQPGYEQRRIGGGPDGRWRPFRLKQELLGVKRSTVDFRAIEIDFQEAVSRFLNVPGKSGRQSVNFYSKCAREIQRVSIDWLPDCAR